MKNGVNIEENYIRFEWNLDEWIKISDLSESLIGYEKFIKSTFKVFNINTNNIEFKVHNIRKWSIIVDLISQYNILQIISDVNTFLDILKIIDIEVFNYIQEHLINIYWNTQEISILTILETIEKYWIENPIKTWVWLHYSLKILDNLLSKVIKLIKDKKIKHNWTIDLISDEQEVDFWDIKIKWKYIKKIKKDIVNKWKAKDLLEPIINENIETITIGDNSPIDKSNIELFLWEGNQILPQLRNWEIHNFIGSFTAMQSNKWETMKFKSEFVNINWKIIWTKNKKGDNFLFVVNIPYWQTTENYINYYWESKKLNLEAEILRANEYTKPKLKIIKVIQNNPHLFTTE